MKEVYIGVTLGLFLVGVVFNVAHVLFGKYPRTEVTEDPTVDAFIMIPSAGMLGWGIWLLFFA